MSEELPSGWTSARLAELAAFNPKHLASMPDATPVTFVPMAAVSESSPELDTSQIRPLGEVRKGYTHFSEGDVLFAKITPCMENGKGGVASGLKNGLGCGTTELVVMRSLGGVDPLLLYRFLAQPSVRREAKENFTGTAGQARVPVSFLENLELPLPPLAEQRRIVAKLEQVLGKVESCQRRLAKIPALLKRFRQSVLAAACSGRLTADWRAENRNAELVPPRPSNARAIVDVDAIVDAPERWRWLPLVSLCDPDRAICYGVIKLGSEVLDGIPCLRTSDVKPLRIDTEGVKRISADISAEYQRTLLRGGEVLVNVRGTLGGVAVVPRELHSWNVSREIAVVPVSGVDSKFIAFWIASQTCQNWLSGVAKGVAYTGINIEDLRLLPVAVPPLPEQQEIVRRVEALFALADKIEARYAKAQAQVDRLTPSLLARAFAGKLVPQDPADEPAAMLLERIRARKGGISDPALQTYPEPEPRELKVAERPRRKIISKSVQTSKVNRKIM
ncbi:MAG: restriction endonuclease subunit S [Opitutaceae bacterium]|nr:restriction endonuclease subunit S [Opitutaceae bacterium]